jgi:CRP-like cAMP-binding protein
LIELTSAGGNDLFDGLSLKNKLRLLPLLVQVELVKTQILHKQGEAIEHVYFMQHGIVSTMGGADAHDHGVEVSMIGREGLVGSWVLLDKNDNVAFNRQTVQSAGSALRMSVGALRGAADQSPELLALCLRNIRAQIAQTSQLSTCNSQHSLIDRCARWLLMTHDRTNGNVLEITQEMLSSILGVRRSGVSQATTLLQNAGAIQFARGRITIVERARLELATCKCYRTLHSEVGRLASLVL